VKHTQTLNESGIEHENADKTIMAWRISESEWYVKVPARYREYTQNHRVCAIYRRFGKIEYYQYRVDEQTLTKLESLIGTAFERV